MTVGTPRPTTRHDRNRPMRRKVSLAPPPPHSLVTETGPYGGNCGSGGLAPRGLPAVGSTGLADAVAAPRRSAHVLAQFPTAVYLRLDGDVRVVAVVTADGVHLPNALTLAVAAHERPFAGVRSGTGASVGDGAVTIGPLRLSISRWRDPRPHLAGADVGGLPVRLRLTQAALIEAAPQPDRRLGWAIAAWQRACVAADPVAAGHAADRLLGLGPGLTPSGDDVLAGTLSAGMTLLTAMGAAGGRHAAVLRAVAAEVVVAAPRRTTALSASLLAHAARREMAAPASDLVVALAGRGDIDGCLRRLLGVGHTSGRDLAIGVVIAGRMAAVGSGRR